jgi:alkanesulfonate monooxygenase SsuD/methylene tetrahydromethanopterin reductase-like flavin-dependent oxidoreductase (luciferase family)
MAKKPKLTVLLSELDRLIKPEQERLTLQFAQQARDAWLLRHSHHRPCRDGTELWRERTPRKPTGVSLGGQPGPGQHMPSQIVMMSAIAAVTSRIRLMATATLTPLRPPLLNAKQWATLNLISGGRVTITPIAGWQREEYAAFGIPFEERSRRLDEQLEIMRPV